MEVMINSSHYNQQTKSSVSHETDSGVRGNDLGLFHFHQLQEETSSALVHGINNSVATAAAVTTTTTAVTTRTVGISNQEVGVAKNELVNVFINTVFSHDEAEGHREEWWYAT
ncbi:hypothetical protein AX774_g2847 [Zancudomyces culisetae]|uniref:Uncharacterized protein n=1 Tax=Zancudomyces culisetae TaxID=1213189 RepID=A0A1R1PRX2_ZANCU|nr:hypothetical protein AX774_g5700 [Zancudomyces culisetae]OMH83642.1 hypothetical protein AX774_g2847 [Zancudomyces culisetae]|eukprot:OMH80860.1 hypothetical protein AX774_g5700 [Zancudomyces culisetae]